MSHSGTDTPYLGHTNHHRPKKIHPHRHVDEYSATMRQEKPSSDPLAAYVPKPQNIAFSSQASGENIILLLRQHPVTQLKWIATSLFMAVLPMLFDSINLLGFLPENYQFAALIGWYMLLSGFIIESFLMWFFNVYIVTDERIIDIDFSSLIHKNISSAKIDNIEDTTAATGGFFAALFDYGSVTIQTAAQKREFEFSGVPHPNRVTSLINELILEEEREKIEGRVT